MAAVLGSLLLLLLPLLRCVLVCEIPLILFALVALSSSLPSSRINASRAGPVLAAAARLPLLRRSSDGARCGAPARRAFLGWRAMAASLLVPPAYSASQLPPPPLRSRRSFCSIGTTASRPLKVDAEFGYITPAEVLTLPGLTAPQAAPAPSRPSACSAPLQSSPWRRSQALHRGLLGGPRLARYDVTNSSTSTRAAWPRGQHGGQGRHRRRQRHRRASTNICFRSIVGEVTDCVVYLTSPTSARRWRCSAAGCETDYRYYAKHGCWLAFLFTSALGLSLGSIGSGSAAMRMLGAAVMGICWQQMAGLGHDLGHSGVTHNFHTDHIIGSLMSACMGLSVGWWKSDHNTHHVVCNAVEHDPNIQHMPMLAITDKIFEKPGFYDTYHKKVVGMDWLAAPRLLPAHLLLSAHGLWPHQLVHPGLLTFSRGDDSTIRGLSCRFERILRLGPQRRRSRCLAVLGLDLHLARCVGHPARADCAFALVDGDVQGFAPHVRGDGWYLIASNNHERQDAPPPRLGPRRAAVPDRAPPLPSPAAP